ncbi:MAG TPA: DUF4203 domain-containing protein [Vicinamibacterales bacterium]|nr:DUF4203 domain-containing protein [Vicinamibacterales bacterium]
MLPSAYAVPAAIVLLGGGLLACFAGYRLFKVVLGVYGFILGALVVSSALGPQHTVWTLLAAAAGGALGALALIFAYFIGVALVGAGAGAILLHAAFAAIGREPHVLLAILAAIAGAAAAMMLQRYVIIITTAFGGAWTVLVGGLALGGDRLARSAAAQGNVWVAYPLNPAPGDRWIIAAWLVLGIVGALVQFRITAKGRK